jgi:hypothetical protein
MGFDSHVETTCDTCAFKRLLFGVLFTQVDETWHFSLSELDFLSTESGEGDVCDFVSSL